jgi:hypothetical protein
MELCVCVGGGSTSVPLAWKSILVCGFLRRAWEIALFQNFTIS